MKNTMKVQDVMTARKVKYCSPDTKLHNAVKLMKTANCGALPVVDQNSKVVGIVTDRDIALSLASRQNGSPAAKRVSQVMTRKVQTVNGNADLNTALQQMRTKKVGRLPVVDQLGKLQGILSMHNLIATSLNGQTDFGKVSATGESIAKTIKALSERYSLNSQSKRKLSVTSRSESWEERF